MATYLFNKGFVWYGVSDKIKFCLVLDFPFVEMHETHSLGCILEKPFLFLFPQLSFRNCNRLQVLFLGCSAESAGQLVLADSLDYELDTITAKPQWTTRRC